MKKLGVILSLVWSLSAFAQQTQTNYQTVSTEQQIIVINDFSSSLNPDIKIFNYGQGKALLIQGFSISFYGEGPAVVTTEVQFGYIRDGVLNIIFTEIGEGTTFSWEDESTTGRWAILPTDTFVVTSTDSTSAQVTIILEP